MVVSLGQFAVSELQYMHSKSPAISSVFRTFNWSCLFFLHTRLWFSTPVNSLLKNCVSHSDSRVGLNGGSTFICSMAAQSTPLNHGWLMISSTLGRLLGSFYSSFSSKFLHLAGIIFFPLSSTMSNFGVPYLIDQYKSVNSSPENGLLPTIS